MEKNHTPDGGPAFPCEIGFGGAESNMHQTGSATAMQYGMSLLDHFAGLAMQGMLANGPSNFFADGVRLTTKDVPEIAYQLADLMLTARSTLKTAEGV
jgi:hypothetical protein